MRPTTAAPVPGGRARRPGAATAATRAPTRRHRSGPDQRAPRRFRDGPAPGSGGHMTTRTRVTVPLARDEGERRWGELDHEELGDAAVTFKEAPGDRGTEIHVDVGTPKG